MKPYFTKYLPVEGDIKEVGDIALYPNGFSETATLETLPDLIDNTACKKAKLFLCSRDIQVGDKFWEGSNSIDRPYSDIDYIDTEAYPEFDRFKVIGEVSPGAVWVKEGMEFNEEDLAYRYSMEDNPDEFVPLNQWRKFLKEIGYKNIPDYLLKPAVCFKCPTCNTFH